MKGDFTRSTFQPNKHYTSVRMQQGRLQLDSDWNEQVDIQAYLRHAQAVDMIGADSGVPTSEGDSAEPYRDSFKISVTPDGSDLAIAPGRLYANGTFCELEATPFIGTFTASNRIKVTTLIVDGRQLRENQWIDIEPDNNPDLKTSVKIESVNNQTLEITLNLELEKIKTNVIKIKEYTEKQKDKSPKLWLRRVVTYNTQPDYINPEEALKKGNIYLAYVDVWQRHITAIEDPTIREVALNGSDTTTRTKTIWQIKLKKLDKPIKEVGGEAEDKQDFPENKPLNNLNDPDWESLIQQVWGKFITQSKQRQVLMNACAKLCSSSGIQSNGIGYQRLENLLYRVEIYEPSQTEQGENQGNNGTNKATFKWSRDNGSIVSPIEKIEGNIITIRKSSQDAWMSSRAGQWIEITNEEMELKGQPGVMVPLSRAFDNKIEFNESRIVNGPIPNNPSQVRLWSHDAKKYPNGAVPIADDWIELETGIKVQFDKDSVYKTGDYWLIPARNATNDIEWPHNQAESQKRQPLPQPPKGIHHDYCPLALVQFDGEVKGEEEKPEQEEQESKTIRDLRVIFPPLMRCLDTAGGIISGTLEVQSGLYVTRRYDKNEKRYITGKLGVGTKKPLARLHIESPTAIPGEGKISSTDNTVTGSGDTFESLDSDDAIIIRDSSGKIQTRIVTRPPSDFGGKSLEIDAPFDSDLEDVNFEYQPASDHTLDIVRLVDRDRTTQLLVNAEGKVGIGTSTPYNQLDVLGGVAIGQAYAGETKAPDNGLLVDGTVSIGSTLPSDATNFKLYVNGNIKGNSITAKSGIFRSQEGANLSFQTGDTTRIAVAGSSGHVGIGIDPDVDAKLNLGGTLKLTNNDQTAAVSLQIDKTNSDNWLQFTATNLTRYSFDRPIKAEQGLVTNSIENYNNQSLVLQTGNQERIAIAANGNVGIGLTNPAQQLLVVENGQVGIGYNQSAQSAMLAVKGNVGIGTANPEAQLHVVGTVQVKTAKDAIALGLSQSNKSVNIGFQDSRLNFTAKDLEGYSFDRPITAQQGIVTNRIENHDKNQSLVLQTNDQDRIAIAHDTGHVGITSNVGIGLSNPAQKLIIENGNVGIGYNDSEQSAMLAVKENVGIGITKPNTQLHVIGTVQVDAKADTPTVIRLKQNSHSVNINFQDSGLQFSATNLIGYSFDRPIAVSLTQNNETAFGSALKLERNTQSANLGFQNQNFVLRTNNQDAIAIAPDGEITIGSTNTPNKTLHVNGNVEVETEQGVLTLGLTQNTGSDFLSTFKLTSQSQSINLGFQNQNFVLQTNDQDAIAIAPDGNISIGNTATKNGQLQLNGTFQVEATQNAIAVSLSQNNESDFGSALQLATNTQSVNLGFQNNNFVLQTNDQDSIAINHETGNLGIGLDPDTNAKLNLGGALKLTTSDKFVSIHSHLAQCEFNTNSSQYYFDKPIAVDGEIISNHLELKADEQSSATISYKNGSVMIDGSTPSANDQSNVNLYVNGKLYAKSVATETIDSQTIASVKTVSNGFYQVSSKTLKEDINDLSSQEVAALLRALNPVKFIYTEDESKTPHAGFIAEDTPDLLTSNEKQAIKVVDIVAILTKVVQDHRKTLTDLVKVVRKQQAEITALKQTVQELETQRSEMEKP